MEGSEGSLKSYGRFTGSMCMKLSLGVKSLALFLVSVLFLLLLTLFESSLTGLSLTAERTISLLLLVLQQ